ncbi:MAG TPA: elongation factor P [bacterium]|nr:elongation factor P [bacterium]
MTTTNDLRSGLVLEIDGTLFFVVEFQHVKPGKGGAFVRIKLKNVDTGRVIERTFNAGEKVKDVRLDRVEMQYLYKGDEEYCFMNRQTYDQVALSEQLLEEASLMIKEGDLVTVLMRENEPVAVELPTFVDLKVAETAPGVKGDTVSGGGKPATLETGLVVQVPFFIGIGDVVRVDTRTRAYVSRV